MEDYSKYRGKYTAGWQELANQRFKKQREIGLFDEDVRQAPLQAPGLEQAIRI